MEFLQTQNGEKIAYHQTQGSGVGVVFLGGFMSDMEGTKALFFEKLCRKHDRPFVRFDYSGHGASSGDFTDGTIGQWLDNVLNVLDNLTQGPQILIGSSMGGWLMCLAAQQRMQDIHALIGIAAAPDFIEDFSRLTSEQAQMLEEKGVCHIPCEYGDKPYTITQNLIEEACQHVVLKSSLSIQCPVRLFHGLNDTDVLWQKSLALAECINSTDVVVQLVKGGDHRLATEANLQLIADQLVKLLNVEGC